MDPEKKYGELQEERAYHPIETASFLITHCKSSVVIW